MQNTLLILYSLYLYGYEKLKSKLTFWRVFVYGFGLFLVWGVYANYQYSSSIVKKDLGCVEFGVSNTKELKITRAQKQGGDYTRYVYVLAQNQYGIKQINYERGAILPVVKNNTISVELHHKYIGQTGENVYTPNTSSDVCHP